MNLSQTTDNNCGRYKVPEEHYDNLSAIGNCNVSDLCEQNPNLLVFPQSFGVNHDEIEKNVIFTIQNDNLTTYNMMGFVGKDDTQLTISSRFAKDDKKDYFLHYMLQKVLSINILKFDQTPDNENIWDFLLYLFPYYLKKAYSQGLYKSYIRKHYNDNNIRGSIDVGRHLRLNIPFRGNVAYSTREYSYDNPLMQLIRHTIEYIKSHPFGEGVLTSDSETIDIVNKIYAITQGSYNKNNRQKIIFDNLKLLTHPYFTEYRILQKICLKILRYEKISFGEDKNKIYGLLFDGAWLWEEYLNKVLKDKFVHPENKTGKHKNYLFENFQPIYPDFISKDKPVIVGDAKYMHLESREYSESSERATSVYYKTITYMYRFNSDYSVLLFPYPNDKFDETYKIKDTDGVLRKVGLGIPSEFGTFSEFIRKMEFNENEFYSAILNYPANK